MAKMHLYILNNRIDLKLFLNPYRVLMLKVCILDKSIDNMAKSSSSKYFHTQNFHSVEECTTLALLDPNLSLRSITVGEKKD